MPLIVSPYNQFELSFYFASAPGKKNMEFADACMRYLNVTCHVVGEENFPADGSKLIFACNHPQGGIETICIAHVLGKKYDEKIKFYANKFLCCLEPLKELFLPGIILLDFLQYVSSTSC